MQNQTEEEVVDSDRETKIRSRTLVQKATYCLVAAFVALAGLAIIYALNQHAHLGTGPVTQRRHTYLFPIVFSPMLVLSPSTGLWLGMRLAHLWECPAARDFYARLSIAMSLITMICWIPWLISAIENRYDGSGIAIMAFSFPILQAAFCVFIVVVRSVLVSTRSDK